MFCLRRKREHILFSSLSSPDYTTEMSLVSRLQEGQKTRQYEIHTENRGTRLYLKPRSQWCRCKARRSTLSPFLSMCEEGKVFLKRSLWCVIKVNFHSTSDPLHQKIDFLLYRFIFRPKRITSSTLTYTLLVRE